MSGKKEEKPLTEAEYKKLKHDLETLILLNAKNEEARKIFEHQLDELKKKKSR